MAPPGSADFRFHPVERVEGALRELGLDEVETIVRDPYPEVEHPSRRAYVFARKPFPVMDLRPNAAP